MTGADPTRRLAPVVRLAPAKLNLTLAIVGRRSDGFHDLHSVAVPLLLADRVSLAVNALTTDARRSGEGPDSIHVDGVEPCPPAENLALRAIAAARGAVRDRPTPGLAVRLEKRIPVAAGLGGGSSDAAAALDGAFEAWGADVPGEDWRRIAIGLGSDVPFFAAGGPALLEGRGERVTSMRGIVGEQPGVLLVTPAVAVATGAVFDALSGGVHGPRGVAMMTSEHLAGELGSGVTTDQLLTRAAVLASANDLLPAAIAIVPGLLALRRRLMRILGRPIGMSGSGPTCWVLYPSAAEAARAAEVVRQAEADGGIEPLGRGPLTVIATTIVGRPAAIPDSH